MSKIRVSTRESDVDIVADVDVDSDDGGDKFDENEDNFDEVHDS
jgi:hypothetical protein